MPGVEFRIEAMVGVREAKKASVRERLVDAAARLFLERGVEHTTMDDIAAAAGTSRTSVFNYFGYKEAILVEIGARYVRTIEAQADPADSERSPRDRARRNLDSLADAIAQIAAREPTLIAAVAREMTHSDAARRTRALERMQYPMLIEGLLRSLASTGSLRRPEAIETLIRQLVDLTSGVLLRAPDDASLPHLRAELRANVDLFCEGAFADRPATAGP
ncbi:MAG: helix-turn-helix domain-containing protein [Chloroflexota bacterium]